MPAWFSPSLVVLIGAAIVATGTYWSSWRQSNLNAELRDKNDQIIKLQSDSLEYNRGSDSVYFMVGINVPYENGKLELLAINPTTLPAFDVELAIRSDVDAPFDTPEGMKLLLQPPIRHQLGTITNGAKRSSIFLKPGWYQINISTRAGKSMQMLRFGPLQSTGSSYMSYVVSDWSGKELQKSTAPDNAPRAYND